MVHSKSTLRQKLSVHVVSTAEGGAGSSETTVSDTTSTKDESTDKVEEGPVKIKDILQFKSNHSLYPLVKPFNNVPRKGTQQQSKL